MLTHIMNINLVLYFIILIGGVLGGEKYIFSLNVELFLELTENL